MSDDLREAVAAHLRFMADIGVRYLAAPPARRPGPEAPALPLEPPPGKHESLDEIRSDLGDCTRCKLCEERNTIVFGEGNPRAALAFVGEGPGADEDSQGRPFVGAAGQLLNKIIAAMGMKREDVYIGNIVKCLRYSTLVRLENGSWERIGRLVAERYGGRVISVDEQGRLLPKRVVGWYRTPLGGRAVYKLSYASSLLRGGEKATTWLTEDHPVLTRRGWVEVRELGKTDEIAIGQGLSSVAHEVVTGSLLGDGSIAKMSAYLAFTHSRDQAEYVRMKAAALRELSPIVYPGVQRVEGREYLTTVARTRASRALRLFRRAFYGTGSKRLPKGLTLSPRIVSIWFLDDGYSRVRSERNVQSEIAAHSFDATEIAGLVERLRNDVGLDAYTRDSSPGRIHFRSEASHRLSEIVAPYCPPTMRYKLHPEVERRIPFDPTLFEPGVPETLFDEAVVEKVDFKDSGRSFYCIDVEDTHNFVTSGGVVHNCRPPKNRTPEEDEIRTCSPFIVRQIESIRPRIVCALGLTAAQTLTCSRESMGRMRGRIRDVTIGRHATKLMATYHPAYLLRSPEKKKDVWEDMKKVMAFLKE